jgi:hypothetical protein
MGDGGWEMSDREKEAEMEIEMGMEMEMRRMTVDQRSDRATTALTGCQL